MKQLDILSGTPYKCGTSVKAPHLYTLVRKRYNHVSLQSHVTLLFPAPLRRFFVYFLSYELMSSLNFGQVMDGQTQSDA